MKPLIVALLVLGVAAVSHAKDDSGDAARILANYSLKTFISFSTSVTTVPYTCARNFNSAVCQKRRMRRIRNPIDLDAKEVHASVPLESTLDETLEDDSVPDAIRKQRLGLTIWLTSSSTYTITSTSTNSSTTFSLSYYCSIVGANLAPSC
ncbi:uncharacterized protein LOC119572861 [Penaeus monodon]|uniref:uncharacterized protein LOC119572861 n=1 Tax=Penaeus monodon TaxID=6687 RepID=UPI0018A7D60D|nr:uncharacterized protein LOC119572861 [Penaeus monodon]